VKHPSLEWASRDGLLKLTLFQDLRYQSCSGSAPSSQPVEGFSNRALGYQSTTTGFVDGKFEPLAIQYAGQVNHRSSRIGCPNAVEPTKIAIR
jgi:hypothetical protein